MGASRATALLAKPPGAGKPKPPLAALTTFSSLCSHFIKYIPAAGGRLLVLLAAQSGVWISDLDGKLRCSLHNHLAVLRRHVVSDLCAVRPAGSGAASLALNGVTAI